MFQVVFWILERRWSLREWLGRCATTSFSDLRSCSKIYFPDSLTVGLSSNFDSWSKTCHSWCWLVGSL